MDEKKKYFLLPGTKIGNRDLPGGKLECKEGKDPLEIDKKHYKVIGKSIDYLIATGKAVDADGLAAMNKKEEPSAGKSEARVALETEAAELEIDFNDRTSAKELAALIDAKNKELEEDGD